MGKNTSTEALGTVAAALERYISDMNVNIQKMKDAARDCSDNMGSDRYSANAIADLEECIKKLSQAMEDAEETRRRIIETKNTIEED